MNEVKNIFISLPFVLMALVVMLSTMLRAQTKPNVVIMVADNVDYGNVGGTFQNGEIRGVVTPRIDKLQSDSLILAQFITKPGCTPSRAGLITRRYAHRSGSGSIIAGGTTNTLKHQEITLAEIFKSRGYATAMTGKWHLCLEEQSMRVCIGLFKTTDDTRFD